jgi:hypothetical protein
MHNLSRLPTVFFFFNIASLWSTSFTKSEFRNKRTTARPTIRARQRAELFNDIPYRPSNGVVICFSILAVWDNRWLSDCLLFCDSAQQTLHLFLTQFPNYSFISQFSHIRALLLAHVRQEKLHRKDDEGQWRNWQMSTEPLLTLGQWYQYVPQDLTIKTAFQLSS